MFSTINTKIVPILSKQAKPCNGYAIRVNRILQKNLTSILISSLSTAPQQSNEIMSNTTKQLADSILTNHSNNSRLALSRAITLIESKSYKHQIQAELLLNYLINHKNNQNINGVDASRDCFRIGWAGPPGAGKSTLIETLGQYVLHLKPSKEEDENKLAVLCIDPSSSISGRCFSRKCHETKVRF